MVIQLTDIEKKMRENVCLPLDNINNLGDLATRTKELSPAVGLFKIGFGTFTKYGPDAINIVEDNGSRTFLDLKFHDIPNTVADACDAAVKHGVYMFNVHASGGYPMMVAARESVDSAAKKYGVSKPKILAVTVLTSIDLACYIYNNLPLIKKIGQENSAISELSFFPFKDYLDLDIKKQKSKGTSFDEEPRYIILKDQFEKIVKKFGLDNLIPSAVEHYAQMAVDAELDGIVCSAKDLETIKYNRPANFEQVTPGIEHPNKGAGADQKRVLTPGRAIERGATVLVVGRAITSGKTPEERLQNGYDILQDMAKTYL